MYCDQFNRAGASAPLVGCGQKSADRPTSAGGVCSSEAIMEIALKRGHGGQFHHRDTEVTKLRRRKIGFSDVRNTALGRMETV